MGRLHDRLSSGAERDIGAFGPKEPSGFWRSFREWREPRFDDIAIEFHHNTLDVKMRAGQVTPFGNTRDAEYATSPVETG